MSKYFDQMESIYNKQGDNIKSILGAISNRYIGNNPSFPFVFRAVHESGFKRKDDYRYVFDLTRLFPDASNEQVVYVWGKLWSSDEGEASFLASAYSPMEVYLNGKSIYKSDHMDEKSPKTSKSILVRLSKGWNNFVIQFIKTPLGFGGEFGTARFKNFPFHFLAPTPERAGQEGFIVTKPLDKDLEDLPVLGQNEKNADMQWLPAHSWNEQQLQQGQLQRIYGLKNDCVAWGWTKAEFNQKGETICKVKGTNKSPLTIFIDGDAVYSAIATGTIDTDVQIKPGVRDVLVMCACGEDEWGFDLALFQNGKKVGYSSPCNIKGIRDPWLYIGPFVKGKEIDLHEIKTLETVFDTVNGEDYWRVDLPDTCVRPFLENTLFGKWNYPLGVTLYGLLQTGLALERTDIIDYVKQHVEVSTSFYQYSLWDREKYGAAGVNNQLSAIDSLDDCGSFASLMLELTQHFNVINYRPIADDVAEYISDKQARLEDGALYRATTKLQSMSGTMWVDDLYMSVPFLCRYYALTGDKRYIDDAAKQYLLFKKYMFIASQKVMSHVYYTQEKLANGIPWGRGNGWVIFSLSELLAVLPEEHENRAELLKFFKELSEGYLGLQDEDGMWHQVLNDHESYQESSCTSMFTYAFARGVRYGWLDEVDEYTTAVCKAWEGLSKIAIDQLGNVYGVCKGSGHSFTPRYYKYELSWILNDPHGTGIVMLAGIETLKLKEWLGM
jgi:unsaturated rhamnogalacturonyl hydrolase